MSHFKERKEKDCLNCGKQVQGRYCGNCGQENIDPRESVWHLITHFFYDVTHFDGKFFTTARFLILKPGFLTAEYIKGRRAAHLHPVRIYVFTSAIFFLIYFSFVSKHAKPEKSRVEQLKESLFDKKQGLAGFNEMHEHSSDTVLRKAAKSAMGRYERDIELLTDSLKKEEEAEKLNAKPEGNDGGIGERNITSSGEANRVADSIGSKVDEKNSVSSDHKGIDLNIEILQWYKNEGMYREMQDLLPEDRKDGIVIRGVKLKVIRWLAEKNREAGSSLDILGEKFKHTFPTMLFISLPFFALFLKLLYIRKSKYYYADHGIFAIHTYAALFILMLFYYLLDSISRQWHLWIFSPAKFAMVVYMLFYVFKGMRNVYGQGRLKTLFKYFLLGGMTVIMMSMLAVVFLIISAFKV